MATIAEILLAKGNAAAANTLQRGNIYADLIRNLSSVPGQVMQQQRALEQDRIKQQIQQQQLQIGGQELDTGKAAAEARQRNIDAQTIIGAIPRGKDGLVDLDAVEQAAAAHGGPLLGTTARSIGQTMNSGATDYQRKMFEADQIKQNTIGEAGLRLYDKPDLGNLQLIVGEGVRNKWWTDAEGQQMLTQGHDDPASIPQIARQMTLGSKEARAALAPKMTMQKPDERPLIQQPQPGGGLSITPVPGVDVIPKPPTDTEYKISIDKIRAKKIAAEAKRGPAPTAAELDQLAAYDQGKNVTTSVPELELDAYARSLNKRDRTQLTAPEIDNFNKNKAAITSSAAFQQHMRERDYDVAHPSGQDTLVKVEHQDAQGNTVVEWLPKSDVKGQTYKKPVSAALATRLASAQAVNQTGNDIIAKLSDPAIAAMVGPAMGRFNTVRDFIGNPPPELAELAGAIESYALANMGVHGMRSVDGAAKINQMLNEKGTPASLIAKIKGLQQFSTHLLENEGRTVPGATPTKAATPNTDPLGLFK